MSKDSTSSSEPHVWKLSIVSAARDRTSAIQMALMGLTASLQKQEYEHQNQGGAVATKWTGYTVEELEKKKQELKKDEAEDEDEEEDEEEVTKHATELMTKLGEVVERVIDTANKKFKSQDPSSN